MNRPREVWCTRPAVNRPQFFDNQKSTVISIGRTRDKSNPREDLTQWQKDINSWTTPPSIGDPKTDPTLAQDSATDINGKPEIDRSNQSAANTDSHDEDQAEQAGTTDTEHNDPQGQAD